MDSKLIATSTSPGVNQNIPSPNTMNNIYFPYHPSYPMPMFYPQWYAPPFSQVPFAQEALISRPFLGETKSSSPTALRPPTSTESASSSSPDQPEQVTKSNSDTSDCVAESDVSDTNLSLQTIPTPNTSSSKLDSSSEEMRTNHKNNRTNYSVKQVRTMEQVFSGNRYPKSDILEELEQELGIQKKSVKVWFQNKRARTKKVYSPSSCLPTVHPGYMAPIPSPGMMSPSTLVPHGLPSPAASPLTPSMYPGFMPYPMYTYPYVYSQCK